MKVRERGESSYTPASDTSSMIRVRGMGVRLREREGEVRVREKGG